MTELLSKFMFPKSWGFKRTPIRPVELQVLDFEKNYDYDTVWNDAIQVGPTSVLLIGPPLYNSIPNNGAGLFYDKKGNSIPINIVELDRVSIAQIHVSEWIDNVSLSVNGDHHHIKVNQQNFDFRNKKVIVTISKNHPISWLKQWIDYHKTVHNIEGLLLYNNRSTLYTSNELELSLQRDDMIIKVVEYDVPFGVMGGGSWEWQGRNGTFLPWDSDFSQYVMLEHAKWRYLHCAKLAINADTDELLIVKNSTLDGVAEYCQSGEHSVLLYDGVWIEPVDSNTGIEAKNVPFDQRHFSNYWHTTNGDGRGIGVKWMLNPRENMQYQWHLHKTYGPHYKTDQITFAHFFAMNTSWSYQRDEFLGDKNKLESFDLLKNNFDIWIQKGQVI